MSYSKLVSFIEPSLVCFEKAFSNQLDFFEDIFEKAYSGDFVLNDFLEKIILREESFPTGIKTEKIAVAIPHTDAEYINKEFIALYILERPIVFKSMEDNNEDLSVEIIFVLGLKEAHSQLEMLQSLIQLIQNDKLMTNFKEVRSYSELVKLLEEKEKKNEKN